MEIKSAAEPRPEVTSPEPLPEGTVPTGLSVAGIVPLLPAEVETVLSWQAKVDAFGNATPDLTGWTLWARYNSAKESAQAGDQAALAFLQKNPHEENWRTLLRVEEQGRQARFYRENAEPAREALRPILRRVKSVLEELCAEYVSGRDAWRTRLRIVNPPGYDPQEGRLRELIGQADFGIGNEQWEHLPVVTLKDFIEVVETAQAEATTKTGRAK